MSLERLSDHERYERALRTAGFEPSHIAGLIRDLAEEDLVLDNGLCPRDRKLVTKTYEGVDAEHPGKHWFGYACECGFMRMRIESLD
jgi:hypothetical protein